MFTLQVTTDNTIDLITATLENITLEEAIIIADRQAQLAIGNLIHPQTLDYVESVCVFISSSVIGGFVATFMDGEWSVDLTPSELSKL